MEVPVLLRTIISRFDQAFQIAALPDIEILGVKDDSRPSRRVDLFVARPATQTDGRQYVTDAAARGAVAVVTQQPLDSPPLPQIVVKDACAAASILANLYHGDPSSKLKVLAVTGT